MLNAKTPAFLQIGIVLPSAFLISQIIFDTADAL